MPSWCRTWASWLALTLSGTRPPCGLRARLTHLLDYALQSFAGVMCAPNQGASERPFFADRMHPPGPDHTAEAASVPSAPGRTGGLWLRTTAMLPQYCGMIAVVLQGCRSGGIPIH